MRIFQIFFFLFFFQISLGQQHELDHVSKEELLQRIHAKDTSAEASIVFKKAKTKFYYTQDEGYQCATEFEFKIKIFKKEGLNWGNFKIPVYTGYQKIDDDAVEILSANTFNLNNGKIEKEKVTSIGKKEEEISEFWKSKIVIFPNIKVGSILELKYVIKTQNIGVLPDFQYQYSIPVDFAQSIMDIPEFYIYKAIRNGAVAIDLKESLENTSTRFDDRSASSAAFFHKKIHSVYTASDIPAFVSEPFVTNNSNYYAKIEHELQTIRMPDKEPKQVSQSWKDVALSIYQEKYFGKELEKNSYFLDDLKRIIKSSDSEMDKMRIVFEFVQKRITWNDRNNYLPTKPLQEAYEEKIGNTAEINLVLVAMLRMSGLQSDPVIMSTKDNGIALFPNQSKLNHVIASVTIEGKKFLLDASSKFSSIDLLPLEDLNWFGQQIKKTGETVEVDLMPQKISKDIVTALYSLQPSGSVIGKIRENYLDYNAFYFRTKYKNLSQDLYLEKLENENHGIKIKDYSVENKENLDKPIVEQYSFEVDNGLDVMDNKIFFNPLLFFSLTSNYFKQEKRICPVDFVFPNQDKFMIAIKIPEGYEVESLPNPINIGFSDNQMSYKFDISTTGNLINVSSILENNTSIIAPNDYVELKAFFNEVVKKQTEKIVLKRI